MSLFEIETRDPHTAARTGTLRTAHGDIATPAFVPLASQATVKGLLPAEVSALGAQMVLGNTFHLMLNPGAELIERFGGLHRFMGWDGPIITDSGGFQIFSIGYGNVADEIKGRASSKGGASSKGREPSSGRTSSRERASSHGRAPARGQAPPQGRSRSLSQSTAILALDEEGVRFRSYVDGSEQALSPERSMAVQAALGSDIALAFDECTPFHVERDYTAHSMERTHRWLARCLAWHHEHAPAEQLLYGIVQGGVYPDLRRESSAVIASSGCDGVAIGGCLGENKQQMYGVVESVTRELEGQRAHLPRHLLGIGEVDDLIRGVELGVDTFDCAAPTRLGRHGTALVPKPSTKWRLDLTNSSCREDEAPLVQGCPCPACSTGLSKGYLGYLMRTHQITGPRLLTAHNIAFTAAVMRCLREAIRQGELARAAAALRQGASPYSVFSSTSSLSAAAERSTL